MEMESSDGSQGIRLVDKRTASLISSGEVISSLALAVKELIENSLDANASSISVTLHNYGIDCIEVSDNGSGIKEIDFENIAGRHCTSKIDTFEDLSDLTSFGFRGEALSSLCSLSEVTIVTRHSTSIVGTKLVFTSEGKVNTKCPVARQIGTTVTLRELFINYPVRRKQLIENFKKEYQKLVQLITPYCIGFNDIQIHCRNHIRNKREDFLCVNKNSCLERNIVDLFGHNQVESIQQFIQDNVSQEILDEYKINDTIKERQSQIVITGFISKCDLNSSRSSSDRQYYFINNRPVEFKRLKKLVNDVYSDYCKGRHPFVLLKIEAPRNTIDVNISPDKRSLRVDDEDLILALVKSSLLNMYNDKSTTVISSLQNTEFRTASEILKTVRNEEDEVSAPSLRIGRKRCSSPFDPEFERDSLETHVPECDAPSSPSLIANSPHEESSEYVPEDSLVDYFTHSERATVTRTNNNTVCKKMKTQSIANTSQSSKQLCITDLFPSVDRSNDRSDDTEISSEPGAQVVEPECDTIQNISPIIESTVQQDQTEPVSVEESFVENDCTLLDETAESIVRKEIRVSIDMDKIKETFLKNTRNSSERRKFKAKLNVEESSEADNELKRELHKEAFKDMEIIGQFNKGFVIAQYMKDLFIIDQHASDEKYNYENLCATTVLESQPLIHPLNLELGAFQESVLINNLQLFAKSGFKFTFDYTARPGKRAKLTAVPMSKDWIFGKQDIEEMLHEITESGTIPPNYRPSRVKQMLASRACRKSIMIGDVLTTSQMKKLLANMSTLTNPWTCAHGRPSVRHLLNQDCALFDSSS